MINSFLFCHQTKLLDFIRNKNAIRLNEFAEE